MKPLYSKDLDKNATQRYRALASAVNNPSIQKDLVQASAHDILFWINLFVFTYNPRTNPPAIPFITYEFQDEFIGELVKRIENQKDLLVDKSRDMGVSWCVLTVFTWFWLFRGEGMDFLCGSRKEQYVDKIGDMDTLLQKIRFILEKTPRWMLPPDFALKDHCTYMKIINPHTKSAISGEATNQNFSRGGRRRAIFFDELAFWDVDAPAWRSAADTTNCRIAVSTPCGFNNQFARLRHSKSIDVRSLHWTLHPLKTEGAKDAKTGHPISHAEAHQAWRQNPSSIISPWYESEVKRRNNDPVEVAQELDISYEGSVEGVLFEWATMETQKDKQIQLSQDRKVVVFDPSTQGDDEAVIYVANNGAIAASKFIDKTTPEALGAEIVAFAFKFNAQVIMGDAIGSDVLSIIKVLLGRNEKHIKLAAFKSSEKAENTHRFFNRRAEAYVEASEMLKTGNLGIDDDFILMKQLSATKFEKKNGRIIIIRKEIIKEVCGSSPDRADAWVLIPQALKLTHSRREVEYSQAYRKAFSFADTPNYCSYGDWGDETDL